MAPFWHFWKAIFGRNLMFQGQKGSWKNTLGDSGWFYVYILNMINMYIIQFVFQPPGRLLLYSSFYYRPVSHSLLKPPTLSLLGYGQKKLKEIFAKGDVLKELPCQHRFHQGFRDGFWYVREDLSWATWWKLNRIHFGLSKSFCWNSRKKYLRKLKMKTLRLVRLTEPLCLWLFYVWQQIPYFGSISDDEIQHQSIDAAKTLRKLIGERRLLELAFYFSVF